MKTQSNEIQRNVEEGINNYKRLIAWAKKRYHQTGVWPNCAPCSYGYKTPEQLRK